MPVGAFVVTASVRLKNDCDPDALGGAVTTELCGHWEHDGPCRWPHHNAIDAARSPARFRTLFVAEGDEAGLVEQRVRAALTSSSDWEVVSVERRPVSARDRRLAQRLLAGPRATG